MSLSDIEHVRMVDMTAAAYRLRRFDLRANGKKYRASQTTGTSARDDDPDVMAYLSLLSAFYAALAQVKPDVPVALGETTFGRTVLFVIGVLGLTLNLVFLFQIATGAIDASRIGSVLAPMLIGLVFTGTLVWVFWPFRPTQILTVSELAAAIAPPHQIAPART